MSMNCFFKINITQRDDAKVTPADIVKCYLEAGWSLYSEKNLIIYTGVGDNDDFGFLANSISETEYFDIIKQKEKNTWTEEVPWK